jgi:hypothetical protein
VKAALKCELIGDSSREHLKWMSQFMDDAFGRGFGNEFVGKVPPICWCARITGTDQRYGLDREFIRGRRDYRDANSVGSRGVFMWFVIETGYYYEVKRRVSWRYSERFFCKVTESGDIVEVEKGEVEAWAQSAG